MADNAKPASNGYDISVVNEALKRLANLDDDISSEMSAAMLKCKAHRADQREVIDEMKEKHGIPKKVLRELHGIQRAERKLEKKKADAFDAEEIGDDIQHIYEGLGEFAGTPLGQAAVEAAEQKAA